jgi:RNA polymerase sigma factor for flagellar operon FliA
MMNKMSYERMSFLEYKLSSGQIDNLWERFWEDGSLDAKNDLLLHYNHLVKWMVRRMMLKYNNCGSYDDFVSAGTIGLIGAVEKYDLSIKHEVKFETYAVTRIRSELQDYIRSQDWASPSLRKRKKQYY